MLIPVPRTPVSDLTDGQRLDQIFHVADRQIRVNRDGGKYLLLRLSDASGTIVAMMWNLTQKVEDAFAAGDFVRIEGRTQIHKGALQIIATSLDRVEPGDVDKADFDRLDREKNRELLEQLRQSLANLRDPHLKRVVDAFLADQAFLDGFAEAPAAVAHHHAYPGGLLQHTLDLIELARLVGPRYEGVNVDLLVVGAFLHDLGKIEEMSGEGQTSYTDRGQWVGHIVIGVEMLNEKIATAGGDDFPADLKMQLQHLIVSHHGTLEFGSPRLPQTLEAILLHHLDNLDAKMAAFTSAIQSDASGDPRWTHYVPTLGRKVFKGSLGS